MLTTGAYSSRVTKSRPKKDLLRRASSSASGRSKPDSNKGGKDVVSDGTFDEPLEDMGIIASLANDLSLRDVAQFMQSIRRRMFDPIPERRSGMGSARIAEVLNFRKGLPPVVTVAHVHALSTSNTHADREIAELVQAGVMRKVSIPNRGKGSDNVGDGLVLVNEWEEVVRGQSDLDEVTKEKYISLLHQHANSLLLPAGALQPSEAQSLARCSLLTTPTTLKQGVVDTFSRPDAATLGSIASISSVGSKAASGSFAAIGGSDVFTTSGASAGATVYGQKGKSETGLLTFALPNTGSYLKLVVAARAHLITILQKSSRYKEAPMSWLKERWDGVVASDDAATTAKRIRGEFVGVLPGKTKKWKQFYGLTFEWVLEECVGAGLVECFETRSVGLGVRAL